MLTERKKNLSSGGENAFLVVGGGLAGSLVAWELRSRGALVKLIDAPSKPAASAVAAGLINPLTGIRFSAAPELALWLACARARYLKMPEPEQTAPLRALRLVRLVDSDEQRMSYERLRRAAQTRQYVGAALLAPKELGLDRPGLAFEEQHAYLLDVPALLSAVRDYLERAGCYDRQELVHEELELAQFPRYKGRDYRAVVFCEGPHVVANPWFRALPWTSVRGEWLEFQTRAPMPEHGVQANLWCVPLPALPGAGSLRRFRLGATFDQHSVAQIGRAPAAAANWSSSWDARDQLLSGLNALLGRTIKLEVSAQFAGVRPAVSDRFPTVDVHPLHSGLYVCNGFGGRGCLTIPFYAKALSDHLLDGASLPRAGLLGARFGRTWWQSSDSTLTGCDRISAAANQRPLTRLVHDLLREQVKAGDWALDATVGNGHDTAFLAQRVGADGRVFAIDIQHRAIGASRSMLHLRGLLPQVRLFHADHAMLSRYLPQQAKGRLSAVCFNLGYLPHSNKRVITRAESTLVALDAASRLLAPGGLITVLIYTGHDGGEAELAAIEDWTMQSSLFIESRLSSEWRDGNGRRSPKLLLVRNLSTSHCTNDNNGEQKHVC